MDESINQAQSVSESLVEHAEAAVELWDRQPGESKQWFLRFQRYYLYRGLARSVRRAYIAFVKENYPSKAEDEIALNAAYNHWLGAAKEYRWRVRAEAWDEHRNEELQKEVLDASRFLMENARAAAQALIDALVSPRLQVIAANSILDRIGVPTVSRQELLNVQVPVSADDLAKVKEIVQEWEQSTRAKSG